MKTIYLIVCLSLLIMACETKPENDHETDNAVSEAFEKNAATVMANLKNWESETMDYSQYADNFVLRGTAQGSPRFH